jgi:hypothetical protein
MMEKVKINEPFWKIIEIILNNLEVMQIFMIPYRFLFRNKVFKKNSKFILEFVDFF